jgi:predicted metal-dependent peptidase
MANTKEYKEGYDAAIQSLKDMLNGQNNQNQQGNGQGIQGKDSQGNPAQSPELNPQDQKQADKNAKNNQGGQGSGQSRGEGNTGKVSASDMTTDSDVNGTHKGDGGIAGGFCDKQDGDKLAEQEGYDKDSMNENSRADDWKETALKESSKLSGNTAGGLKAVLDGLYKVSTDWKKTLKNIIGRSLNPAEFRQAFANKNVLVSQNRIARTDKDKYDNLDYICCFIDSSGSMSDKQLKMVLSEVYSLALQKKPMRIVCVQCDTKIQWIKEYTNLKDLKRDALTQGVKGRGGTVLKPCWELLRDDKRFKGKRAEIVLCFTDGYCDQYKRDVKTMQNLFWCILDNTNFKLENKDASTKVLHFKTSDIK